MQTVVSKFLLAAIFVCLGAQAYAQTPPPRPRATPRPVPTAEPAPPALPVENRNNERAIAVDPNVTIQIPCISQARVTVNGWSRDEVRVFIRGGSNIGFSVHEKSPKSGKPIWLVVRGGNAPGQAVGCLSGERIDIEVPTGAALAISGREIDTRIDSVKKIELRSIGGNATVRNVPGGITAETYEGNVAVENSGGQITLKTTTGNIVAFGVSPGQVGDVFKAATNNGLITLQNVEHRQINANSVTGDLLFDGKFLPGGIYTFKTTEGAIRLVIPAASSCRIAAWYGYGTITSEIPMKTLTENESPVGKRLTAEIGSGNATVNLNTTSGRISITKQTGQL